MKRGFIITFFFISLALALSISSSFENGNPNFEITKQYSQGDSIKGWINISLEDETINSLFTDSFGNSISLIDFLELNVNVDYECSPSDCENDYSSSNPETEKAFILNKGESKIIGIIFTGNNFETISDFSIDISSTALESTRSQLYIDILNDGEFEWKSYQPSNNFYNEKFGCFNSPDETVLIYNQPYCEKINIPAAPNVEIGAYVIEETGGTVNFEVGICDENYISCNYCDVTATTSGRVSCIFNEIIEKQDYFVCINTKSVTDNNKYKIDSETSDSCGFASSQENKRDFKIFAKPGKFSTISEFTLDNNELQDSGSFIDLKFYLENYIERYGNSCSNGCIVPIKFTSSNEAQTITLSGLSVFYTTSGTPKEATAIYDLTEIPATITSDFQKINLDDANFSILGNFGDSIIYTLDLNGKEIFSDEITIEKIPQIISVFPKTVIAALPAQFTVNIETFNSLGNITNYKWDFGDGNTKTTMENKVTHTYDSIGTYDLKISITDSNFFTSSKAFNITVKTPKEAINFVLKNKLDDLNSVSLQIQSLQVFYRNSLNKILNLPEIETELSSLQQRNATAISDEDYVNIMNDLIKLQIPISVFQSEVVQSIKFFPNENAINLEVLKSVAGGDYNSETRSEYEKSILLWYLENVDAEITSKGYSVIYDGTSSKILNFFEIKINENQGRRDSYFIMPELENLNFKENYQEKQISNNYIYIELGSEGKVIEFSTTEDISFIELPAFISPSISELPVVSINLTDDEEKRSKLSLIVLSVILAFVMGFIAYILVQRWYKKKYEDYLFKNKNDLYNMVSYIESAKRKGSKNKEIEKKLRKAGWKSEQVKYVMKKYVGKRTGMFEIPVDKILNLFKKKKHSIHPPSRFQSHSRHKI